MVVLGFNKLQFGWGSVVSRRSAPRPKLDVHGVSAGYIKLPFVERQAKVYYGREAAVY